jgi:hypothetical protein
VLVPNESAKNQAGLGRRVAANGENISVRL